MELVEKIRFLKTELGVYKDPERVKTLCDKDIKRIYGELKKVYKHY